jgi:hypothetical protein
MTEDITKSILDLKNKLFTLDKVYETKLKAHEKREQNMKELEKKFEDMKIQQGGNIIKFNIGGQKLITNRHLVINSIFDSVLKDILKNLESIGRPLEDSSKVFIDRNPNYFKFILDIIRKSSDEYIKNNCEISVLTDIPLLLNSTECTVEALKEEILYYFKEDSEKVLEMFKFKYTDKENDTSASSSVIGGVVSVVVSNELPSEELTKFRAKSYKDISTLTSKKAYFISYDSTITFEFEKIRTIESIEIKPFTTDLNYWVPCEGAGAFCFFGLNNTDFDFLATIPEDYGLDFEDNKKSYKLTFNKQQAKFIRFQTGDFTLSISYIKFHFKD